VSTDHDSLLQLRGRRALRVVDGQIPIVYHVNVREAMIACGHI